MYTVRRVTRPKIGNIVVAHHGTQVLFVDGRTAQWQGYDTNGLLVTIIQPVIDLQSDGKVYVKTPEQFKAKRPVTYQAQINVPKEEFDRRFQSILTDIRNFSIPERNCETTADTLIEGKPANRQYKVAVGLALVGLAIAIFGE